jgi:predicted DNA-binding transcriptional regulator AlpA
MPPALAAAPAAPPDRLLTKQEVAKRLAVSVRKVDYLSCTDKRFPHKVRTSLRMVRFRESELNRYIAEL